MRVEWDPRKAASNVKKHGVSFRDAATVFGDPLAWTFPDPDHSSTEDRFVTIGLTRTGEILVVAHTDSRDRIRIISARRATPRERRFHEEANQD